MQTMSTTGEIEVPEWTLADRLRKARVHAGIEAQEMADWLRVGRSTISNYETGRNGVPYSTVVLWAELCRVPLEWLHDDSDANRRRFAHAISPGQFALPLAS